MDSLFNFRFRPWVILLIVALPVVCALVMKKGSDSAPAPARIAPGERFNPDQEKDAVHFRDLEKACGPVPASRRAYRMAAVMKFFGNQYWQWLAEGMQERARELNIELDVLAAATESDLAGQARQMEGLLNKGYDAILISPQTDTNLNEPVAKARHARILVLNVNDAVLEDAEHWVGPNQYENGVHAGRYLLQRYPAGGKVAVIKGLAGVYAVTQRTQGLVDTLAGSPLKIVETAHGDWDLQRALNVSAEILKRHPDLLAFYCNNDIMALGVVEAVSRAGLQDKVLVIGTDGIGPALDSIRSGRLTATIDSFPRGTGRAAIEVALRLLEGQRVPRAVYSPQALITRENAQPPAAGR